MFYVYCLVYLKYKINILMVIVLFIYLFICITCMFLWILIQAVTQWFPNLFLAFLTSHIYSNPRDFF